MIKCLSVIISLIFFNINDLTYFQQAHYHIKEHLGYIKHFYKKLLILLSISLVLSFINLWYLDIVILLLNLIGLKLIYSKKIIKLKYTKRIVRSLVLSFLVYLLLLSISFRELLLILNPLINIIVYLLIIPIEEVIKKYYQVKALKLLDKINPETIAITGSAGKTTTKHILDTVLSLGYNTLKTPKSYNTINGISKTINSSLDKFTEYLILEFGASYPKDISKLCKMIKPKYSIITKIGLSHLKTFKTEQNIIKEKMKLLENTLELCVINNDDENIRSYINSKSFKCQIIKVGKSTDSDFVISDEIVSKEGISFKINDTLISSKLIGEHNIYNLSFVYALIKTIKEEYLNFQELTDNLILNCFSNLKNVTNRLELKKDLKGNIIIDDSFSSNYTGFINALEYLKLYENKVLITPGIVETKKEENKQIAKKIIEVCDKVYVVKSPTGDIIYDELIKLKYQNAIKVDSFKDAISQIHDSTVLIENDLPDFYYL